MGWIGPVIAAGVGAASSARGQSQANKSNVNLNRENRRWQEHMSNTAHQRATRDLSKAGLNRILALGQPASSPTHSAAKVESTTKDAAQIAANAAQQAAQVRALNAQTEKTKAETVGVRQMNDIKSGASQVGKDAGDLYEAGKGYLEAEGPNIFKKGQDVGKSIVKGIKDLWNEAASTKDNYVAKQQVAELKRRKFTDNTKRWYKLSNGKWYDLKEHKIKEFRN